MWEGTFVEKAMGMGVISSGMMVSTYMYNNRR
jgi:hypothetical protein